MTFTVDTLAKGKEQFEALIEAVDKKVADAAFDEAVASGEFFAVYLWEDGKPKSHKARHLKQWHDRNDCTCQICEIWRWNNERRAARAASLATRARMGLL